MVQAFPFSGILNYDDPDEVIPSLHHDDALNVQFYGTQPNLQVRNLPGTREKTNPFLTNDNNNLTVGKFYDSKNKRIFFFNYRGDNKKAIYMYDTVGAVYYRLAEESINAAVGSLGITQTPIIHINLIYGDSEQGDILCYIDGNGIPRKINVQRAINGGYGTIEASYLDIAKQPSPSPPYVVYENDTANTVNNCRKTLFRVKIRWVFDDKDKSVTSSQSEMPLPFNAFDQDTDADPTKNCRLAIVYPTGPANVKKVEIIIANSLGIVMSDFYLVASLDKQDLGLSNDDLGTFLFYNDQGYNNINVKESIQDFDRVPIRAGAQVLLNGNVLDYGNFTEGYPNLSNFSDGTTTSNITSSAVPYYYGNYYSQLVAFQGNVLNDYIHIVVRGSVILPSNNYRVFFSDGSDISYTSILGDDAAAVIEGLRVDALANGFTIISNSSNDLVISKASIELAFWNITNSNYSFNALLYTSFNAYDWNSKYGFGLVYFDEKGRTNGVVYTTGFSVQSNSYTESNPTGDITKLNASIYHLPPDWAYYFQWVRTKNLSKSNFVQWVTDRTFKDVVAVSGLIKYAYLSIETLNVFKNNNIGSPLGYSFTSGDRVRFFRRINTDNSTANLYGATKDYEIVASLTNPIINGAVKEGQFIKIVLPPTDGTFDFGEGFDYYFIELYTPAQPVANNLNLYYEFGEKYEIINPTLSNRVHQGYLQNQEYLVQPALYEFLKGDDYVRLRAIQTGNTYTWNIPTTNANGFRFLVPLNFQGSTFTDPNVTPQSVAYAGVGNAFNPNTDNRWFQSATLVTTFKLGGSFSVTFPTARSGDSWRLRVQNKFGENAVVVTPFDASAAGTYTFPLTLFYNDDSSITETITLENDHIFLLFECVNNNSDRQCTFLATNLTLTVDHVINQRCIDPNFSDFYASSVNSNGRAFVFDENANQVTYPVMHRWSLAYQTNTNINQTNRFYAENFDEVIREHGSIMRMMFWEKTMTIFQERKCGQIGVYQRFVSNADGSQQLITSTDIITSNNVQYYNGDYGVGNQPDSVVRSGFVYYFVDPIKGEECRLSRDGITPLSEIYKTKTWASDNILKYLLPYNYSFGGTSRITGTFNIRKDNVGEYLCVLQPGTFGDQTIAGQTMGFDETKNCFTSPYSFAPECIVCAENTLYSWRNGRMYIHDQTAPGTMNRFYGVSYDSTITRVFNAGLIEKKSPMSLTEVSNSIWDCPIIYTNSMSYGSIQQQSNLIAQDFENLESNFSADFLGDMNSIGGLLGDKLKGNLIAIKFRATNPNNLATLSAINLYFIDSPFTSR